MVTRSESELRTPVETDTELRRFYAHFEKVLFPEALIDKLIGDEVMALYVPLFVVPVQRKSTIGSDST